MRKRLCESGFAARRDQVGNRLRLSKIDSSIKKRAPAEFARLSNPRSRVGRERNDTPHDKRPAMALDLNNILARETPRRRHSNRKRTIDISASSMIDNVTKPKHPRRELAGTHRPKNRMENFKSPRPRQTNDRNRTSPGRSHRSDDRIRDVHRKKGSTADRTQKLKPPASNSLARCRERVRVRDHVWRKCLARHTSVPHICCDPTKDPRAPSFYAP